MPHDSARLEVEEEQEEKTGDGSIEIGRVALLVLSTQVAMCTCLASGQWPLLTRLYPSRSVWGTGTCRSRLHEAM